MPGLDILFKRRRQQPYPSKKKDTDEEEEWLCQSLPYGGAPVPAMSTEHTPDPVQQCSAPVENQRGGPEKQRRYLKKKKPRCTKTWATDDTRQYVMSGVPSS